MSHCVIKLKGNKQFQVSVKQNNILNPIHQLMHFYTQSNISLKCSY